MQRVRLHRVIPVVGSEQSALSVVHVWEKLQRLVQHFRRCKVSLLQIRAVELLQIHQIQPDSAQPAASLPQLNFSTPLLQKQTGRLTALLVGVLIKMHAGKIRSQRLRQLGGAELHRIALSISWRKRLSTVRW